MMDVLCVESLMKSSQPWPGFFVGMIKGCYGNVHGLGNLVKMKVIELAHLSAFVLATFKELVF